MFHVKQSTNKTFDAQPLKKGCIKCFAVKVKLQQFVKQKRIKSSKTQKPVSLYTSPSPRD